MRRCSLLAFLLVLAFAAPVRADEEPAPDAEPKAEPASHSPALTIGSKAPALDITHWVKGVEMDRRGAFTPVTELEAGKVYVIEFWATWCGPCVASMPHLSELQAKYKDQGVSIISVSDESLPKVTSFLFQTYKHDGKLQNDRIHYMLTTDPDQSVKNDYFVAAEQTGIPTAFVVGKEGLVEWIGHPIAMDEPLAAVVAGTWNRDEFKKKFEIDLAAKRALRAAQAEIRAAAADGDWDTMVAVYDRLIASQPNPARIRFQKFFLLATRANRPKEAYVCAEELVKGAWDDAPMLNQVAWTVVDHKDIQKRDLDFALKVAIRANELKESKDAAILDTLARVYFERGELEEALAWQTKAVDRAGDDAMGVGIRKVLDQYKKALAEKTAAKEEPTKE